jgi:DNA-binding FrmR family transcriptional regulator
MGTNVMKIFYPALKTTWIDGIAAAVVLFLSGVLPLYAQTPDPAKVRGPEACAECHTTEMDTWKATKHYKTFNEMHRKPEAQQIATKLGITTIKRESLCVNCHYTEKATGSGKDVIAGISCESCHSAGKDWIDLHGDYGGKKVEKSMETPAHRKQRVEQSQARGMLMPDFIYPVASRCYQCHTVPNEKLVNVGGHKAGSDFELVAWTSGEVRHNFQDGDKNREDTPERKRVMYVVGQGLALEANLRGVSKATEKGSYATEMAKRVVAARENLKKINGLVRIPEVEEMIAVAEKAQLKLKNESELVKAADEVGKSVQKFAVASDGKKLAALDSLLPNRSQYKGKPQQ